MLTFIAIDVETAVITRHSRPVVELIPFQQRDFAKVRSAIDTQRPFQEPHSPGGLSVRRIVEEACRC